MLRNKSQFSKIFVFLLWAKYLSDRPRTFQLKSISTSLVDSATHRSLLKFKPKHFALVIAQVASSELAVNHVPGQLFSDVQTDPKRRLGSWAPSICSGQTLERNSFLHDLDESFWTAGCYHLDTRTPDFSHRFVIHSYFESWKCWRSVSKTMSDNGMNSIPGRVFFVWSNVFLILIPVYIFFTMQCVYVEMDQFRPHSFKFKNREFDEMKRLRLCKIISYRSVTLHTFQHNYFILLGNNGVDNIPAARQRETVSRHPGKSPRTSAKIKPCRHQLRTSRKQFYVLYVDYVIKVLQFYCRTYGTCFAVNFCSKISPCFPPDSGYCSLRPFIGPE